MRNLAEISPSSKPIVIPKNSREELRLSIGAYAGHDYADLRLFYRDDDTGEMRPSKKGLTVSPERWTAFREGVDQLEDEMRARGLLRPRKGEV